MEQFTKEQLVDAQQRYNRDYASNPEKYRETVGTDHQSAQEQIEHLLTFVDHGN